MITKTHYEHLKAQNEETLTADDFEDIKEYENANIENLDSIDNPIDESLVDGSNDNLETIVKERNKQAEEAKEELLPIVEEPEEDEKPNNILKYVGFGLLTFGVLGLVIQLKNKQTPQNQEKELMSNER